MQVRVLAIGFVATTAWGWWVQATEHLRTMLFAVQTRRILAQMSERELRDIGLGRSEALMEAARWPWDVRTPRDERTARLFSAERV